MKSHQHSFEALYFPRKEWQWLRTSSRYEDAPDSFVWTAKVQGQNWAWSPRGGSLSNSFDGMKLNAIELETDGSELAAYGLYLKTSFIASPPQDIEWTNAIDVLEKRIGWSLASKGLAPHWKEALQNAGLEPHTGTLAQRAKYLSLTAEERQFCFDKRWDASCFDLFGALTQPVRTATLEAIRRLQVNGNHAKDVSNFALILSKRAGEKAALDLLTRPFKNADELRLSLFRVAQPELARLSDERIDKLRRLHLPPRTSVFGDPTFEKDILKITHTPRSAMDWENFKEWVERPEILEKIKDLLDLYQ